MEDWWTNNALIVSWIKLTIDPSLRSTISHRDTAHDLWEHIKRRFAVKNGQRIQRLKAELAMCRQRGLAIEAYYGKLMQVWTTLDDYRHTTNCGCPQGNDIEKERAEDKLHQFLMGLDEGMYGAVRSSLLSRDPLPSLEDAYNVVIQDEESKGGAVASETRNEGVSFAVQATGNRNMGLKNRNTAGGDKTIVCTACGRAGHAAEQCFRMIGFPPWWGDRPRGNGQGSSTASSSRNKGGVSANAVINAGPQHTANAAITGADRIGFSGLNEEQWATLVQLLGERKRGAGDQTLSGNFYFESWIIDTGASNHMTGSVEFLSNVRSMNPVSIKLPDGRYTVATRQGSVKLGTLLSLENVFFVDGLSCHLISVSQLARDRGCIFQISDKICVIQDRITQMVIGAGEETSGLYFFRSMETVASLQHSESSSASLWHRRLGHPSLQAIESLHISGCSRDVSFDNKACEICLRAKQTRLSFPISSNKTSDVFQLVHCDLWGPYRTPDLCGSKYFLTIVDDFSRATWLYLLPSKREAPDSLRKFISLIERQFEKKIQTIRSDNGSEFLCLKDFFAEQGIIHETSCVGTPQQNGRVERKHRHILNVARALRFQANLPVEYWGYCALTAGYLINRTPTKLLNGKTPFEVLYGKPPPLNHLRVFGCVCYVHNQNHGGDKFASRSRKSIFLGYPFGQKGWRVRDIETGKVSISRDVVFSENVFLFEAQNLDDSVIDLSPLFESTSTGNIPDSIPERVVPILPAHVPITSVSVPVPTDSDSSASEASLEETSGSDPNVTHEPAQHTSLEPETEPEPTAMLEVETEPIVSLNAETEQVEELGRGKRKKIPSTRLSGFVTETVHSSNKVSSSAKYPIADFVNCERFSDSHTAFLLALSVVVEPRSYSQAILDILWCNAMKAEITALIENGTWTIETLPPGKKALGSMWVYKVKYKSDGTIERYKARLVVLGNNQVEGSDYDETFAPVAKMTTVRCFLEVSVALDWEVHQMDVHNAFLHGDLDEEVYMRLPPGFHADDKSKVCRLRKSLYGLKQAPRCWFAKLSKSLLEYGFSQSVSDYSLFTYSKDGTRLHVLVYVDDMIISGNSPAVIQTFKDYMSSCFHMKDLGVLKYFLGIEVARSSNGMYLCQRKYTLDIISEMGLLAAKPASFPLDQNHKLALAAGDFLTDPSRYRRLVGRLIYLGVTRPELSYSVHILSQFMQQPRVEHWEAALRVVRYLKGKPGQGILLQSGKQLTLTAWCDADWAGCPLTRRSLTGFVIQLGGSPISWKTRKQETVSLSSAEAEYRAMSYTVREVVWLKALLLSFGVSHDQPVPLHCDSMSALHLSANPVFHERTKHIEVQCHYIRDRTLDGTVCPRYVSTTSQLADIMTKALGRREFDDFILKLGLSDLHAPT